LLARRVTELRDAVRGRTAIGGVAAGVVILRLALGPRDRTLQQQEQHADQHDRLRGAYAAAGQKFQIEISRLAKPVNLPVSVQFHVTLHLKPAF
jgi:hypothetical protein